jgi:hypothetical protein
MLVVYAVAWVLAFTKWTYISEAYFHVKIQQNRLRLPTADAASRNIISAGNVLRFQGNVYIQLFCIDVGRKCDVKTSE